MFIAFCLASSGTYFWNDLLDAENDRNHPTKQHRPIASGAIPTGIARVVGTILMIAGIALAATTRWQAALVVVGYVLLTSMYSLVLKHVAVVDLIAVAAGFVLRAVGGAVATDVQMSKWFSLTISFASLFIVAGKRYAELRDLGDDARTRPTLDDYSLGFLRIVLSVSCGASLVTYCIWAFDTREAAGSTFPYYELSIIPMVTRVDRTADAARVALAVLFSRHLLQLVEQLCSRHSLLGHPIVDIEASGVRVERRFRTMCGGHLGASGELSAS